MPATGGPPVIGSVIGVRGRVAGGEVGKLSFPGLKRRPPHRRANSNSANVIETAASVVVYVEWPSLGGHASAAVSNGERIVCPVVKSRSAWAAFSARGST